MMSTATIGSGPAFANYAQIYNHLLDMNCFDRIPYFDVERDSMSVFPHTLFPGAYTVADGVATYVGGYPDFPYSLRYEYATDSTRHFSAKLMSYFEQAPRKPFVVRLAFFDFSSNLGFHVAMLYFDGERLTFVDSQYDIHDEGSYYSFTRHFSQLLHIMSGVYKFRYESPDMMYAAIEEPPQVLENIWTNGSVEDKGSVEDASIRKIAAEHEGGTCIMWSASIVRSMIRRSWSGAQWVDAYLGRYGPEPLGAIRYVKHALMKYFQKCGITPAKVRTSRRV